jgi:hypothetical protein
MCIVASQLPVQQVAPDVHWTPTFWQLTPPTPPPPVAPAMPVAPAVPVTPAWPVVAPADPELPEPPPSLDSALTELLQPVAKVLASRAALSNRTKFKDERLSGNLVMQVGTPSASPRLTERTSDRTEPSRGSGVSNSEDGELREPP